MSKFPHPGMKPKLGHRSRRLISAGTRPPSINAIIQTIEGSNAVPFAPPRALPKRIPDPAAIVFFVVLEG
jgi:hypothetical protein